MKSKIVLFLILYGAYCQLGFAQISVGGKGGYNLANLTYSGTQSAGNISPLSSFNAGILGELPLGSSFSIQAEMLYSGQGTDYLINYTHGSIHYNYLNVPILMKYSNRSGLFAETGLQIGFLLNANEKIGGSTFSLQNKTYSPDYAWVIGLGYRIPHSNFGIDVRYNLGLINVVKVGSDVNVKNSVFQFDIFFILESKKN
jgi:hypothetical protein